MEIAVNVLIGFMVGTSIADIASGGKFFKCGPTFVTFVGVLMYIIGRIIGAG